MNWRSRIWRKKFVKRLIQKIFMRDNDRTLEVPTKPIPRAAIPVDEMSIHAEPPHLLVGCAQSVGRQREHNEDALLTLTTTLTSEMDNVPFGLYIVADGMGGHQHGEIASGIAVRVMASQIINKLMGSFLSVSPVSPDESIQEIMQSGVQDAHHSITHEAPGGGTTLTAILILGKRMTIAHVGDSRAYHIDTQGNLKSLTRDHSLVERLVELGQITTAEAAVHPQRNVLYRALGQGEPFDADINTAPLPGSGHLMLCSDGLWGVVSQEVIENIVKSASNPQEGCRLLVDAANDAGGPDNITAVLIRLPG